MTGTEFASHLPNGIPFHAIGITRGGYPRHPLYLPGDVKPLPYSGTVGAGA